MVLIIPNQVIEKFMEHGNKLGFLAGKKDGDITKVTHLVIPIQKKIQTDTELGIIIAIVKLEIFNTCTSHNKLAVLHPTTTFG